MNSASPAASAATCRSTVEKSPLDKGPVQAARVMLENGFRHLPVIDEGGQVAGVVSLRRVVGAAQAAAKPA